MDNTDCCNIANQKMTGLHCVICGNPEIEIDEIGWLCCDGCCSLSPGAVKKMLREGVMVFSVSKMEAQAAKIAAEFGYTMEQIRGDARDAAISKCRHRIFYELRQRGLPFSQIGKICKKDHSSVIYGYQKVELALKGS